MAYYYYILLGILLPLSIKFRKQVVFIIVGTWLFQILPFLMSVASLWHRDPIMIGVNNLRWLFRLKYRALKDTKPVYRKERMMILMNHRTTADSFIVDHVCENTGNYLSGTKPVLFVPFLCVFPYLTNSIWFFSRGGRGSNLEPFFQWIDKQWTDKRNVRPNLIVFPEGHRNATMHPLPLKKGMIRYAFERKVKVQIMTIKNMEKVVHEKELSMDLSGVELVYYRDDVIDPNEFTDGEEWYEYVKERFARAFHKVMEEQE